MSNLAQIAQQKKQQWLSACKEQQLETENWQKMVQALYHNIKQWLLPLEKNGLLHYKLEEIDGKDQNEFTIEFFNGATIKFTPVGLDIVSAYGRIDMQLGLRKLMIILKEKNGKWLFTERYSLEKTPTYDFNQETFEQIVTEFVESF